MVTESPSRVKYLVVGLVLLTVIVSGIWYFSRSGPELPRNVTSPSSGATLPAGQKSKVEAPLAEPGPTPWEAKVNPKDGLKYVRIPPGTFMMGCSPGDNECEEREKPAHEVTITKGFWMGQTEVTVGAYKRFAAATGKAMPPAPYFNPGWSNEQMPIMTVIWDDAQRYCTWAGGRLLTEAEWEYAGRAGSTGVRYGPIDEVAWYGKNRGAQAHQVGEKRANGFGLYDMLGNVFEWVNDWYDGNYYRNSPSQDPTGPASGRERVLRGGSWASSPRFVRVSYRISHNPAFRSVTDGFRCGGEVFAP
jgi:formylglycine-generating enzyme required for sulfatase activity